MRQPRKSKPGSLASRGARMPAPVATDRLLTDLRALIDAARGQVAQAVNAGLVTLYWHVGRRIRQEVLTEERAAYGEQIVTALSAQLTAEYGRGFNRRNLFRMIRFAAVFSDEPKGVPDRRLSRSGPNASGPDTLEANVARGIISTDEELEVEHGNN